ncbi:MAG: energy-coupling factor ABC transporter permease, partial [Planctomycetota bacterium]
YALASGLVFYALKKTPPEAISKTAVMGAVFFVSSLIHFKVGITSVHLTMTGLAGILLGPSSVLAIVAGLFFQAVMFQHGGLSTLGVNALVFSLAALFVHSGFRISMGLSGGRKKTLSLLAGFFSGLGVLAGAILAMAFINLSGREFAGVAYLFSASHLVLSLVEGLASALVVYQVCRVKPQMIPGWNG